MRKALFWDFDGTLAYMQCGWTSFMGQVLAEFGYAVDRDAVSAHMRTGLTWHTPEQAYPDKTGAAWWELALAHFNKLYQNHGITQADALNHRLRELLLAPDSYTLYPDTLSTLEACEGAGYESYLLSNHIPELDDIIAGLGLRRYFKAAVISARIGYEKPRKEIFAYAIRTAGFPAQCVMIGDNPVADIAGGKAAGMKTILVHTDGISDANAHCETLAEIPLLLAEH